jgi:paraquat-inducible protein B
VSKEQSVIKSSKARISPIWIVPIAAVILGLWLAINAYLETGPSVQITFASAAGLKIGETSVKVLNVDIGIVTDIRLRDDMGGVIVEADLQPEARKLLREDSEFWVVKPRVSGLNVSGLSTLLSGAYIEFAPGVQSTTRRREFSGLDSAPAIPIGTPGIRLQLTSKTSRSVSAGSSVLYRGIGVGTVESVNLDVDTRQVTYVIFIDAPFDRLITSNTRFWNASGISAELDSEGVKFHMASLQSMLSGGVSFSLPKNSPTGDPAVENTTYRLYPNENSIHEDPHRHFVEYVVQFGESLRGLNPGAPVTYRGVQIGSVEEILIEEIDPNSITTAIGPPIPVLIRLEPGRLELGDTSAAADQLKKTIKIAVSNGLRASLISGSLITGSRLIDLDFYADLETTETGVFNEYPTIPTTRGGFDHIQVQISGLLDKLNDLPVNETLTSANAAISELESMLAAVTSILQNESAQGIGETLTKSLAELDQLMQSYSSNSEFHRELNRALVELKNTLDGLQIVTDRLAEKPNSLVFPGEPVEDPEPKAPRQ